MKPFSILTLPTPSLRELSLPLDVSEVTKPDFQVFLDTLVYTMVEGNGVGIAAPQIGKNIRVIVVTQGHEPECYINPEILKRSEATVESEEGCLSVPHKYGIVTRHKKITLRALNRHGRQVELEARNFAAIVFQHEIDHLDGILFIDKATNVTSTGHHHI